MIKLNTERFILSTASRDEMQEIIDKEADETMKVAYREMLQGALDHPEQWEWYAIWIIERHGRRRRGAVGLYRTLPRGVEQPPDGHGALGFGSASQEGNWNPSDESGSSASTAAVMQTTILPGMKFDSISDSI